MKRILSIAFICGIANFTFSQNFGIDESSPNQKLVIGANGGIGFSGSGLNSGDKKLYSPGDGDLEWMTHNSAGVHGFAVSHQGTKAVYLNTSGNSYLNGGNVGIGITVPTAKLHLSNGDASYALFGPNATWNSYLYVGAGQSIISSGRAQVISTNGNLHLDAGTGQNIYIANYNGSNTFMQTGGGNVGIATTSPTFKLDVNGSTRVSGGLSVAGTAVSLYGGSGRIHANFDNAAGGGILIADDGGFFDYNDGWVTFNGSTGLKIAGNNGAASTGNSLLVTGNAQFGCRSGFWAVADGRICMETTLRAADMHTAIGTCRGLAPGCRVCEHNDFQQACGVVANPYGSGSGWYGDHGVAAGGNWDDEFGTWNSNGCASNNDGPAESAPGGSKSYRCCY